MRQITQESVNAFLACKPFKKANMQVEILATENGKPCLVVLRLHGNRIAELHKNERGRVLKISNAGWQSNTTKERLNALPNVSIYQKNWQWYLNGNLWDGKWIEV